MTRVHSPTSGAPFWFTPHATTWWPPSEQHLHVATAPVRPRSKEGMMRALVGEFALREGPPETWDALTDALRDLRWLKADSVLLIHRRIPDLPRGLLAGYLDSLSRAHTERRVGAPRFHVVFPIDLWSDVMALAPPM